MEFSVTNHIYTNRTPRLEMENTASRPLQYWILSLNLTGKKQNTYNVLSKETSIPIAKSVSLSLQNNRWNERVDNVWVIDPKYDKYVVNYAIQRLKSIETSLNENLLAGPDLLNSFVADLHCFRAGRFAVTADI